MKIFSASQCMSFGSLLINFVCLISGVFFSVPILWCEKRCCTISQEALLDKRQCALYVCFLNIHLSSWQLLQSLWLAHAAAVYMIENREHVGYHINWTNQIKIWHCIIINSAVPSYLLCSGKLLRSENTKALTQWPLFSKLMHRVNPWQLRQAVT